MNIAQAKEYIKQSVSMYLKKDEYGDYRIPVVRQRPIFVVGAPGIGKSAIMEQIASELEIALVSYSMTHHTRQSALGLPFIKEKEYGGSKYDVSEYTMSEIIASLYETMESSGIKEGILFLDEINCVSETLYPSMLQFLQFKTFGKHAVPEGWVIVTAGNPPQYNRSVKEFDVVTLDRLRVLSVEEDYDVWRQYALTKNIHPSVIGFLDGDKESFYHIEAGAAGNIYVTARGWEDLSEIIYMHEESGIPVLEELIGQYLHSDKIVREFAAYYDLFVKYRHTFDAGKIVAGNISPELNEAVNDAGEDEKIALIGILLDYVKSRMSGAMTLASMIKKLRPEIAKIKESSDVALALNDRINAWNKAIEVRQSAGTLNGGDKKKYKSYIAFYEHIKQQDKVDIDTVLKEYNDRVELLKKDVTGILAELSNAFDFMEGHYDKAGKEMLIFVTELTVNPDCAAFLAMFKSDKYDSYSELLMVGSRDDSLRVEIEEMLAQR